MSSSFPVQMFVEHLLQEMHVRSTREREARAEKGRAVQLAAWTAVGRCDLCYPHRIALEVHQIGLWSAVRCWVKNTTENHECQKVPFTIFDIISGLPASMPSHPYGNWGQRSHLFGLYSCHPAQWPCSWQPSFRWPNQLMLIPSPSLA